MMKARSLGSALCVVVLLGTQTVEAQWGAASLDREHVARLVEDIELTATFDMAFYAGSIDEYAAGFVRVDADLLSWTPRFSVGARLFDLLGLEFQVPLMFGHFDPDDGTPFIDTSVRSDFRAGNPFLAGYFSPVFEEEGVYTILLRAGFGFAFPGANIDEEDAYTVVASGVNSLLAIGSRGYWEPYQWRAEHFGFAIPVGVEAWLLEDGLLYLAADWAFFWEVYNGQEPPPGVDEPDDTGGMQLALEGGVEPLEWLRVSLRLTLVGEFEDNLDDDDDVQSALEPRVTVAFGPLFAQLGIVVNLDEPYGVFGGDDDFFPGVYGIRLTAGGRF